MKYPDTPQSGFSQWMSDDPRSSAFRNQPSAAASGPELVSLVPDPSLARELAQTIVSDQFELTERAINFASDRGSGPELRLARR